MTKDIGRSIVCTFVRGLPMVGFLVILLAATLAASGDAWAATPSFPFIASGWIAPPQTIDMSPFWGAFGLPDRGTNYYSSGAPIAPSSYWERFDPKSPLYEAWFGVYVVDDFPCANEWSGSNLTPADLPCSIANVQAVSSVDQIVWLAAYQDPSPMAQIDPSSVIVVPAPDGYFFMYARMQTHSDVGGTIPPFSWYPPYASEAALVEPYAPVTYNAVARFKYLPAFNEFVIVYASGAEWTLKDGTRLRTPPTVAAEQIAMVFSVTFQ